MDGETVERADIVDTTAVVDSAGVDGRSGGQEVEDKDIDQSKETVYVSNLNEKVSVNRLREELERVFKTYGSIIQITAHKNLKMKGQAFITFEDKSASQAAIEGLQDHQLLGKAMRVAYAKNNSDNYYHMILKDDNAVEIRKQLKAKANEQEDGKNKIKKPQAKKLQAWKAIPPNKILLIQNLGSETANSDLLEFFEAYNGFINSRLVKVRNLSFIEFENEALATRCLEDLSKEKLAQFGPDALVTYAKK